MNQEEVTTNQLSIATIFYRTQALVRELEKSNNKDFNFIISRLLNSVIRPLRNILPPKANDANKNNTTEENFLHFEPGEKIQFVVDDKLWNLAQNITALMVFHPEKPELVEATATLQHLVINIADNTVAAERLTTLKTLQILLEQRIQTNHNGPYLVTNVMDLYDDLGQKLISFPQMALCRCGGSSIKPFCDGTHAANGFTDNKDDKRVEDKRETYIGEQVTIFDNRGICQHSGFCTDSIATVFRLGQEPFITPSGGRMDEIIRVVRNCPSGALSFAIDNVEERNQVDYHYSRQPKVEVTKDGPYRITGAIKLVDENQTDVKRNEGASVEHYALCRCGKSQNKPFCSGMHWYVDFHDPVKNETDETTIFEWAGGYPAMLRMTRLFYEKYIPQDDLLAPVFATMSHDHPERVAKWLSEVFCGPPDYSKEYGGYKRMLAQHINKQLTEEQRARWVMLLSKSAKESKLPNDAEFRSVFGSYIEWGSRLAVENSQTNSKPPENMPMPHWDWHTAAGAPGSRISALQPEEKEKEAEIIYPKVDEAVGFEKHIRQLFRKKDRQSMSFAFDLWKYEDVKKYAEEILNRLQNGSMPCDGAWEKEKLDLFSKWHNSGMAS